MADDLRELLHGAAPEPEHRPDFERVWERGRRQRQVSRWTGASVAVIVLVVAGLGLSELVAPVPGTVEVAEQPDDQERFSARGQNFGEAETDAGVPYGGQLQVSAPRADGSPAAHQRDVCLTLRTGQQGEGSTARGCGRLEDHLQRRNEPLHVISQAPDLTALAAWTPREIGHALWHLPEEELRIAVTEATELPGSVVVAAIDDDVGEPTSVELFDTSGERVDTITIEVGDQTVGDDGGTAGGTGAEVTHETVDGYEQITSGALRLWAHGTTGDGFGLTAIVDGVLGFDTDGSCLFLDRDGRRYPVVWPHGAELLDDDPVRIGLPAGSEVTVGMQLEGGGGYHQTDLLPFDVPDSCLSPTGEVALFNPQGPIQISE